MSKKVKVYIGFRYEAEGIMEVDSDWGENLEKLSADAQAEIKEELASILDYDEDGLLSDWMMSVEKVDDDTE